MSTSPKITVGMPAFNRAQVLKDTIRQVLDQTFQNFEFIIYNDGSKDNTSEVVRSFNDPRIQFMDCTNLGPPHPLNAILKAAQGEYIIMLHDHDFFHPTLLEKSVAALEKYPNAGFVLQGSAWIDEDGVSRYHEMLHDLPEYNNGRLTGEKMLLDKNSFSSIFHACCMVRRLAHIEIGLFYDISFGLYADTDVWLRFLQSYNFVYIKEVLFKFRTREQVGHFLSDREFEILNWNYNIHKTNINRYFSVQDSSNAAVNLENKFSREQRQITLKYASNNKAFLFKKGLSILLTNNYQSFVTKGLALFAQIPFVTYLIVISFTRLNIFRKWLRGR